MEYRWIDYTPQWYKIASVVFPVKTDHYNFNKHLYCENNVFVLPHLQVNCTLKLSCHGCVLGNSIDSNADVKAEKVDGKGLD